MIAERTWLQLPVSHEHTLSPERVTFVITHFELCCPSLLCLRGASLATAGGVGGAGLGASLSSLWLCLVQMQQL